MRTYTGKVSEICLGPALSPAFRINCPVEAIPAAGRYLMAWSQQDIYAPLAVPLFNSETTENGFLAVPPEPLQWNPGDDLFLYGPLGRGFSMPVTTRRVALGALGHTIARLALIIQEALGRDLAVSLYADCPFPGLPSAVEIHPLAELPSALGWADYLALDVPIANLSTLDEILGISNFLQVTCAAQILVAAPMPCAGLAKCGACSVKTHRGWKLACKDGPVFELRDL